MGNSLVDSSLKASKVADSHFRNNVFQIDIHNNPIFNEASVIEQPIVPNIITEVLYSLEMPLKTFQNGGEFRYRNAIRATVITTKDDIVTPASFNKPGSDLIKINANVEASAKYR